METYRELYFKGEVSELKKFVKDIKNYAIGNWEAKNEKNFGEEYLFFDYVGDNISKARVCIHLGRIQEGELKVGNIVPLEKDELKITEYNNILLKFYEEVIEPYKNCGTDLVIDSPSDDKFNPLDVISEKALKKLEAFCNGANKSTGSSHPCDRERWFDFICQTVDDSRMIDASTLATFLKDEDYWGNKPDGYIGVIGKYAWDEDKAYELALEYESLCEIIEYYRRSRGI